jgi:outer membrane lipoprotein SlyB
MKKVFLALSMFIALTVTSCKQAETTGTTGTDSTTVVVDSVVDSTTVQVDTVQVDTVK